MQAIAARKSYGLIAKLVWDGGEEVRIPTEMGQAAPHQMQGTWAERLTELSGRVCYDSLGKGRSSTDYHKHILEVGHFSVCEHAHVTIRLSTPFDPWVVVNRPGIWARRSGPDSRITFNPRVILDWNQWSRELGVNDFVGTPGSLGDLLSWHMEQLCPNIVKPRIISGELRYNQWSAPALPEHHEEKWISLFLSGSRGWSHEHIRHRFRTGVSQRSTRFVDEDGSPWIDHPLAQDFIANGPKAGAPGTAGQLAPIFGPSIDQAKAAARHAYVIVAEALQKWLIECGIDKFSARKQARGAARGYLGNGLATEMIFSASVAQWKRMLRLRCHPGADAEIRVIFDEALPALQSSRYGEDFAGFQLQPAGDGIGHVATES